jgi:predicted dehydrogenase
MKIAFIGAGGIAGNYRGSLKRLDQPISVICDVNMARAEAVAKEENAKPYADHKEMLLKEKPDVVFLRERILRKLQTPPILVRRFS